MSQGDGGGQQEYLVELQERLAVSLADYKNLADSVPHLIWVMDAQGQPLYYNQPWIAYTGVSLTGPMAWQDVLHPEDADRVRRSWEQSLQTSEP